MNNVEYSRRLTIEKDLEKNDSIYFLINLQFDSSGTFLSYSTLYGIKMLNLRTNSIRHFFGTAENARFIRSYYLACLFNLYVSIYCSNGIYFSKLSSLSTITYGQYRNNS